MPELPEVETIVRGLAGPLEGARIRRTRVLKPDVLRTPRRRFGSLLAGRRFEAARRRGKNIVLGLDGDLRLVVNLGMTGRLLLSQRAGEPPHTTHPAVRFSLDDRRSLVFDDVRRFGTLELLTPERWSERESALGPEPLSSDFTFEILLAGLQSSRSPVRSWLLDQRKVAGVGNIYAAEALFLAGIHPACPAREISREHARRLHEAVRNVLSQAIRHRGTTLRDYRDVDGRSGGNAPRLLAYGREGEACPRCGDSIERTVFGNRSAFFCPTCQGRGPG